MKTRMATVVMMMMALLCACDREADPMIAAARQKILRQAVEERDRLERRVTELEKENAKLSTQLSITQNRLEIATDSSKLYQNLLEDSSAAKLARAKELLRQAEGK